MSTVRHLAEREADFQSWVVDLARLLGWKVHHTRPARTGKGWRTPVAYDGAGFVDLVLVHPVMHRIVFAELKGERGRLRPEQEAWRDWLEAAGAEVYVWRPQSRVEVEGVLRGRISDGAGRARERAPGVE